MHRDVVSAYAAAAMRVASWAVVSAFLFRRGGADALGLFALIRATMGLLAYTSLGLAPAVVRFMAGAAPEPERALPADASTARILHYHRLTLDPARHVYATALLVGAGAGVFGAVVTVLYALSFEFLHHVPGYLSYDVRFLVLFMGGGVVLRMVSEVPSAVLQARGRIALDNQLLLAADLGWAIIALLANYGHELTVAGLGFLLANGMLLLARSLNAATLTKLWIPTPGAFDRVLAWQLIGFGLLVALAQVADFLYAPTDFILINYFLGTVDVAIYTPAVQIDAGLLLLVAGLATVLLPRTALAHTAGDVATVRRYYVAGTLASLALLTLAATAVYFLSAPIFRLWLGEPMVRTQAILPLVLIHTIVGGSSAVGRSILLGMGKVKPFAIAAILAGVGNVLLSIVFVKYLDLGLRGIILGTICVVTARCAVWMPWYVLRTIKRGADDAKSRNILFASDAPPG